MKAPSSTRYLRWDSIREFHDDERGDSGQLGGIMNLAIGALLLVALLALGYFGIKWIYDKFFGQAGDPDFGTPPTPN